MREPAGACPCLPRAQNPFHAAHEARDKRIRRREKRLRLIIQLQRSQNRQTQRQKWPQGRRPQRRVPFQHRRQRDQKAKKPAERRGRLRSLRPLVNLSSAHRVLVIAKKTAPDDPCGALQRFAALRLWNRAAKAPQLFGQSLRRLLAGVGEAQALRERIAEPRSCEK
eukprot:scaffold317_cov260-Pinguiococcus_pyrenoidosus.AAC.39